MCVLAMYHEWQLDDDTRDALVRAGRFLRECCVESLADRDDLLAVWSRPELTRGRGLLQAKLGGTGLGLVALLSAERVHPGSRFLDDLRRLGWFIVYMQKDDGSFYSKYVPAESGRNNTWTSWHYPGEAALGLILLHERDPSPLWISERDDLTRKVRFRIDRLILGGAIARADKAGNQLITYTSEHRGVRADPKFDADAFRFSADLAKPVTCDTLPPEAPRQNPFRFTDRARKVMVLAN